MEIKVRGGNKTRSALQHPKKPSKQFGNENKVHQNHKEGTLQMKSNKIRVKRHDLLKAHGLPQLRAHETHPEMPV